MVCFALTKVRFCLMFHFSNFQLNESDGRSHDQKDPRPNCWHWPALNHWPGDSWCSCSTCGDTWWPSFQLILVLAAKWPSKTHVPTALSHVDQSSKCLKLVALLLQNHLLQETCYTNSGPYQQSAISTFHEKQCQRIYGGKEYQNLSIAWWNKIIFD